MRLDVSTIAVVIILRLKYEFLMFIIWLYRYGWPKYACAGFKCQSKINFYHISQVVLEKQRPFYFILDS